MKIPNYDSNKKENKKRSLCDFLEEDFRLLAVGETNCGKTNVVLHLLRRPCIYFDEIIIFTTNKHQNKLLDLQNIMNDISNEIGYDILKIRNPEEVDINEYKSDNRKIVIFDDCITCSTKIQSQISEFWTQGRHFVAVVFIFLNLIMM